MHTDTIGSLRGGANTREIIKKSPMPRTRFVGRERHLREIEHLLNSARIPCCLPGGRGASSTGRDSQRGDHLQRRRRADCPHDDDMRLAHFGHQSIFFGGVSCRDVIYGPQLRSLIDLRPGCIHHVLLRSAGRWPLIHHLGDLLPQFQTGVQITSEMDAGPQA
jgi:hypothetical protein